ncbi:hypothetical protein [Rhizobium leguminosarum]|uniref:hypothetical protein n=1 Tax=Rhizobium leguminosarum TaxID=384 RepID=UPI0005187C95|nr:hypothetical protein [Rhizobium leguminosarum]
MTTPEQIIAAYKTMVGKRISKGFEPSMLTIMFKELNGSQEAQKHQMYREVARVYAYLLTRFHKYPGKMPMTEMPLLIGCADWPVYKTGAAKRPSRSEFSANDGMHFGSMFLLPPRTRTPMNLGDMIERERPTLLRRGPITSLHVERVADTPEKATGYVLKSLERQRITLDEVLVLPEVR